MRLLGKMTFASASAGLLLIMSTALARAPDAVGAPAHEPSPVLNPVVMKSSEPCLETPRTRDVSIDPVAGLLRSPVDNAKAADGGSELLCGDVFATTDLAHKRSCAVLVVQKANLSPADSVTAMRLLGLLFEMKR